jgi:hypothetical protein
METVDSQSTLKHCITVIYLADMHSISSYTFSNPRWTVHIPVHIPAPGFPALFWLGNTLSWSASLLSTCLLRHVLLIQRMSSLTRLGWFKSPNRPVPCYGCLSSNSHRYFGSMISSFFICLLDATLVPQGQKTPGRSDCEPQSCGRLAGICSFPLSS